jgi:hypothetical protein
MALDFEIDCDGGIVYTTGSGSLIDDECFDHQTRLMISPDFAPTFNQLADFSDVDNVQVTVAAVHAVAMRNIFGGGSRRAFVAPGDQEFGLARMFEMLTNRYADIIRVFRDIDDAHEWLGLD